MAKRAILYRVVPFEGGWQVKCDGLSYPPIVRPDKQAAVSTAILCAQQHEPSRVLVQDQLGNVELDRSYGPTAL